MIEKSISVLLIKRRNLRMLRRNVRFLYM